MTISATIPVEYMAAANAELEALGHGSPNFSIPLRSGSEAAAHAGLHAWLDDWFVPALKALDYPGLVSKEDTGYEVNFQQHVQEEALEWSAPTLWFENPVNVGDQRTHDGTTWESLVHYNGWAPPVGWREVVARGYPD